MEAIKEAPQPTAAHRALALGLALATTAFIAGSVVTVVTGSTHVVGAALVRAAVVPLRVMLGG